MLLALLFVFLSNFSVPAQHTGGGKRVLLRMTFEKLPTGDVLQFGEQSADGGKAWQTRYELTYPRKTN